MSNDYSNKYRGCTIKVQEGKKSRGNDEKSPWLEAQVRMPDKSIIYVQAERKKILILRAARLKIDAVLNGADTWRRWATGQMARDYLK